MTPSERERIGSREGDSFGTFGLGVGKAYLEASAGVEALAGVDAFFRGWDVDPEAPNPRPPPHPHGRSCAQGRLALVRVTDRARPCQHNVGGAKN